MPGLSNVVPSEPRHTPDWQDLSPYDKYIAEHVRTHVYGIPQLPYHLGNIYDTERMQQGDYADIPGLLARHCSYCGRGLQHDRNILISQFPTYIVCSAHDGITLRWTSCPGCRDTHHCNVIHNSIPAPWRETDGSGNLTMEAQTHLPQYYNGQRGFSSKNTFIRCAITVAPGHLPAVFGLWIQFCHNNHQLLTNLHIAMDNRKRNNYSMSAPELIDMQAHEPIQFRNLMAT